MSESWTILKVLEWTTGRFAQAGIESARLDAQVLLSHTLACNRVNLYMNFDKPLAPEELTRFRSLIKQRLAGRPVAYLVGEQEFWSLSFAVDDSVLIPRRDTETVIEVILDQVPDRSAELRIADIATGSGAIALALAKELPRATVVATDLSGRAAELAARNAEKNGLGARVDVRVGDLYDALATDEPYDVVVSNPPYIRSAEIARLSAEVQCEPRMALDGGTDGLVFYRRLIAGAPRWLRPGGLLVLEHGFDQAGEVAGLIVRAGTFENCSMRCDLGKNPRVTFARRSA